MSNTVAAVNLKPGMIARRVTLANNTPFRVVDKVMSAGPYYGKTVVFRDGDVERVAPNTEFQVSAHATMPSASDVVAGLLVAYATTAIS